MMKSELPEPILIELSGIIKERLGLHFPEEKWTDLERGVKEISKELHLKDINDCLEWFRGSILSQAQIELLASHFTIGETYFFRESESFAALEKYILPTLIDARQNNGKIIRIWSAGCSSGEEAYSIAILLSQLIPDIRNWNITILATDINPKALKKANKGIYGEWSFRKTSPEIKAKYFRKIDHNQYEILPSLKKMITTAHLNLAEGGYPSLLNNTNAMDLIFCRNVLMYFVPEHIELVLQGFYNALVETGLFAVSASELSLVHGIRYQAVKLAGSHFYKKKLDNSDEKNEQAFWPVEVSVFSEPTYASSIEPIQFPENALVMDESQQALFEDKITSSSPNPPVFEAKKEVVTTTADSDEALEQRCRALANQGKLADSLIIAEQAIGKDNCNANFHYLKALIQMEMGDLTAAMVSFKKAIYLDPNFVLSYFSLGNIARNQNKNEEARKYYAIVLSILKSYSPEAVLPHSEGMTAMRMIEVVQAISNPDNQANLAMRNQT